MTVLDSPDTGRRVVRGGAARTVGYGATLVLGGAASVLLLRHLGVVDFGRYALVMSLIGLVAGITDAGLTAIGTRELATLPEGERRPLVAHLVGLRLAITPVGIALVMAVALVADYASAVVMGTLIAGAGLLLINAQASMALPLAVELRNVRLTFVDVAKQAIGTAGIAALVIASAGLTAFFGVQVLIGVGILALTPLIVGRRALVAPRFEWAVWRRLLLETLPLAAAFVLGVVYFRLLMVLVSLLANETETGYFAAAFRVFEFMVTLPLLLAGVGLPVLAAAAAADPGRFRYVLLRMTQTGLLCGILLALLTIFFAEPALVILGGEQYRPAAPVLRLQALALVGIFVSQTAIAGLVAMRAQRAVAIAAAIGIVTVTVLGLALIPGMGAEGGGLAVAVADALLAATVLWFLRAQGVKGLLPGGFAVRVALATLAGAAPALLDVPTGVATALSGVLFVTVALLLRIVPPEVLHALPGRARAST